MNSIIKNSLGSLAILISLTALSNIIITDAFISNSILDNSLILLSLALLAFQGVKLIKD